MNVIFVFICFLLTSGHLVVDLCCYGDGGVYDYFYYDARFCEGYVEKAKAFNAKISVRRYILPLDLDEKVDILTVLYMTQCMLGTYADNSP